MNGSEAIVSERPTFWSFVVPIHVHVSIIPHVSNPTVSLEGAYASAMHMPITFGTGLLDRLVYHTGSSRSHIMV